MAPRIQLFGIDIDVLNMEQAVQQIFQWLDTPRGTCRFVVTPNVDHAVMIQSNDALRSVYRDAHLVLADGVPIIVSSRLLGKPLPERVAGSELVPHLFAAAATSGRPVRTFLLGAAPGVGERAADRIRRDWPGIEVVGTYSPPLGFERDPAEETRILDRLHASEPELLIVGLGAPKQELWVHRHFRELPAKVALCVGATIDFLAGEKAQAPVWMRRTGLEWVHRVATEPRRLARRYAKDALVFPRLVWKEWWSGSLSSPTKSLT